MGNDNAKMVASWCWMRNRYIRNTKDGMLSLMISWPCGISFTHLTSPAGNLSDSRHWMRDCKYSPDGGCFAFASMDHKIYVYDADTFKSVQELPHFHR